MPKQAITPSTVATDNIQTKPDVVIGQATSLKQSFDQYGIDSNDYINNTLIPALNGDDGSKRIGHKSPNIGSNNVADALEELRSNIVSVVAGSIPDNSITDAKLSNTAGQVKPRLTTLEGTVSTLSTNVSTVTTDLSNFEDDFEYPLATIVSRQIRIAKLGTNKVSRFKLGTAIPNGASITISLDGGATSLPLKDVDSNAILVLEKGFYEVIADATFFTLRPSGIKFLGTATIGEVLATKTFYSNDKTLKTGTMPNRGTFNLGLGVTVPAGYYSGGTTANGKRFASGTINADTIYANVYNIRDQVFSTSFVGITVTGLSFTPTKVILTTTTEPRGTTIADSSNPLAYGSSTKFCNIVITYANANPDDIVFIVGHRLKEGTYLSAGGFRLPAPTNIGTGVPVNWVAYE